MFERLAANEYVLPRRLALLAELCSEKPTRHDLKVELLGGFITLAEEERGLEVAFKLVDQFVAQGLTLWALALLVKLERSVCSKSNTYSLKLAELYNQISSIDEMLEQQDYNERLGDGRTDLPLVKAHQLKGAPREEVIDQIEKVILRMPPFASRGLPLPIPLFSEMELTNFVMSVRHLGCKSLERGEILFTEGERADSLYLVVSGSVNIMKGAQRLARLGSGTIIGEMALMSTIPRRVTVVANESATYLRLKTEHIHELCNLSSGFRDELEHLCFHSLLQNVVHDSPALGHFELSLTSMFILAFEKVTLEPRQVLTKQGQIPAGLWVVTSGEVAMQTRDERGDYVEVECRGQGQVFGSVALISEKANIRAVTKGRVNALYLSNSRFLEVLAEHEAFHIGHTTREDVHAGSWTPAPLF